jgi:ketosteroid isomerase-like protein
MDTVARSTVQAFYEAYLKLDTKRIAQFLDDDVDWIISGPIDVLAFCGQRRGKAAVLEIFDRLFPQTLKTTGFDPQSLLIDGDRVAMLFTLSAVVCESGRKVSYRVAHFLRFRNDKVFEFRSIIDSFDAAEQVLGHSINVSQYRSHVDPNAAGDLIAV